MITPTAVIFRKYSKTIDKYTYQIKSNGKNLTIFTLSSIGKYGYLLMKRKSPRQFSVVPNDFKNVSEAERYITKEFKTQFKVNAVITKKNVV